MLKTGIRNSKLADHYRGPFRIINHLKGSDTVDIETDGYISRVNIKRLKPVNRLESISGNESKMSCSDTTPIFEEKGKHLKRECSSFFGGFR